MKNKQELIDIIILPFIIILAPSLKLIAYNAEYFNISISETILSVITVSLILVIPLLLLARFEAFVLHIKRILIILLITSLVTSFLLPVNLGIVDGNQLLSFELRKEAYVSLIISLIIFFILQLSTRYIPRINHIVSLVLNTIKQFALAYVILFAVYTFITTPFVLTFTGYSDKTSAPVSSDKNIFIISFDQIQGSFIKGYLAKFPDKISVFDGFKFYPDAATTYPNTNYSISSTLLGRRVRNANENIAYAVTSPSSILAIAKNSGYDVITNDIFENTLYKSTSYKKKTFNISKCYELIRHSINLAFGFDISKLIFKIPYPSTDFSHSLLDYSWQLDLHRFNDIAKSLASTNKKPTIYFMHFLGTHQPFVYKSDCTVKASNEILNSQNIEGAKDDVSCLINLCSSFFQRLKELDLYDNSMIFVISDHGYESNINNLYYSEEGEPFLTDTSFALGYNNIKPAGSYNPMFFYKDFHHRGNLSIDHSPVSLIDAERSKLFLTYRNHGVKIYSIVFDLLPIRMPHVFPPGADQTHLQWLQTVSTLDGAICISQSVADDLATWQKEVGIEWKHRRPFRISWFHLGADIACVSTNEDIPEKAKLILHKIQTHPSFLMVGTIEPRKGYLQVIEAFSQLWEDGIDVNLVIVGKEGWTHLPDNKRRDIPETIVRLRNHHELNQHLFWLEGISDEYLEYVYSACVCLVAASFGEGFGLPLIEAAHHKLPIIARDIPVFREVAGDHAFYFKTDNDGDLAKTLREWLTLAKERRVPISEGMHYLTWKQSAERLIRICIRK